MGTEGPARPRPARRRRRAAAAAGLLLISTAAAVAVVLASAAVAAAAPAEAPSSSSLVDRCISDGRASDPACADARYPEDRAEADVATLCRAMPDMAGCTLRRLCKGGSAGAPSSSSSSSSPFCEPFSLLASLCEEMPTMRGCGAYVALCGRERNSPLPPPQPIAQCRQHPPPEKLVGSDDARRLVREACAEMPMAGCALCGPTGGVDACPDPLRALSAVCLEMGGMRQCAALDAMCAAERRRAGGSSDNASDTNNSPVRELCGGQRDALPPMQMWFHQRVSEVLLWRSWVPRTPAAYAGCIVALLSFGVASVALKTARGRFEAQWIHDSLCSRSPARRAAAAAAEAEAAVAAAAASWDKGGKAGGGGPSSGSDEGSASGGSACCGGAAAAGEGAPVAVAPASSGSSSKGRRRRFPAALLPLSSSSACPDHPDHHHHHHHHHHHRGSARVATCCERHAALGPRTPLQRAANSLLFANCVRALLVGAAAVFDYFNMLAVMTFNAGFFAAVVCGYALGTLLLSHLVVPAPMQQGRVAPLAASTFAGSAAASRGKRRRAFGWLGKARGTGKAGSNGAAAAAVAGGGAATAAAAAVATAANGSGTCCGGGGNDVEAPSEQQQQQQQRQSNQDDPEDPDAAVARHVASSAACEACC